jgi:putative addiction module killer protein
MNIFQKSEEFDAWLIGLKDHAGKAMIIKHIRNAEAENFGDCEPVGEDVSELRIRYGPGHHTYFIHRGNMVYFLLLGGDKSTQKRDIKRAQTIARTLPKE